MAKLNMGAVRFCLYMLVKMGSYFRCVGEPGYVCVRSVLLKTRVVMG